MVSACMKFFSKKKMQKFSSFALKRVSSCSFRSNRRWYSYDTKTVSQIRAEKERQEKYQKQNSFHSWLLYIIPGSITLALGIWQVCFQHY